MTELVSYAQNFEDVMLWRALRDVERGRYVDVGAQSPSQDSVSRLFYERGWRGTHVEPAHGYAEALRAARPDERVVEAALASRAGLVPFYELDGTGLSTCDSAIAESHRALGFEARRREVPAITLDEVLAPFEDADVHWLKVDVEGSERDVLAGWSGRVKPWIVVVESTVPLSQQEAFAAWEPLLLRHGYVFAYFDGLNRFYVAPGQESRRDAFAVPPNIFDDFALSGEASAPFCRNVLAAADAARAQRDEAGARLDEAHAQLQAHEAQLGASTAQLDEAHAQLGTLNAQLEALNAQLEASTARLDAATAAGDAQQARIAALEAQATALEATVASARRDIERTEAELATARAQVEGTEARNRELEAGKSSAEAEAGRWCSFAERLRADHALAVQSLDAVHRESSVLQSRLADTAAALAAERARAEQALARAAALHARVDEVWAEGERHRLQAHHWWLAAEARQADLHALHASSSWRLTAPLRAVRRVLAAPRATLRSVGRRLALTVLRRVAPYPRLVHVGGLLLAPVPALRQRVRGIAERDGAFAPLSAAALPYERPVATAAVADPAFGDAPRRPLSRRERAALDDLQRALRGSDT